MKARLSFWIFIVSSSIASLFSAETREFIQSNITVEFALMYFASLAFYTAMAFGIDPFNVNKRMASIMAPKKSR